jgi:hypothetical protein
MWGNVLICAQEGGMVAHDNSIHEHVGVIKGPKIDNAQVDDSNAPGQHDASRGCGSLEGYVQQTVLKHGTEINVRSSMYGFALCSVNC